MKIIKVNLNDCDKRLDKFLIKLFPNFSISFLNKENRKNKIKVNGKKEELNYKTKVGDEIKLFINDSFYKSKVQKDIFLKCDLNIDVIYEDDNILILFKPAGVSSQEDSKYEINNINNWVKKYLFINGNWDYKKENTFIPGICHRLDLNTKGIIVCAKTSAAMSFMNLQFKNRLIDKYYLAEVYNQFEQKEKLLTAFWKKEHNNPIVMITSQNKYGFIEIKTWYKVLSYDKNKNISTVEIKLITGKTHQIRAHMNFVGHPLVGEKKYTSKMYKDSKKYQSLISYKIKFRDIDDESFKYLSKREFTLPKNKIIF